MYLFTRAGRFAPGSMREAMGFVRTVTDQIHQETGLEVHPWASTMSPDQGTVVWTTFVDDLARLEEAQDKLMVSDSFLRVAEGGGRLFAGPLTDRLAQIVWGEPDLSGPIPRYVAVAEATAANGHVREAIDRGVEIAEAATRITGSPTTFMVDVTGPYGGCRWASRYGDISELERAEGALMADDGWLDLIDRAGPSYAQDAHQHIYRRLD